MAVVNFGNSCSWININSDLISEYSSIYETYEIDSEMLEYALDEHERAHIEYDRRKETLIVIYNVIKQSLNSNQYETIPMTFIVRRNQIITITNHHNEYIVQAMKEELEERPDMSLFTFLFSSLFMITEYYFPKIEKLKKEIENLEIIEVDERFSTVIADNILKELNKNGAIEKRKVVDKVAASIILQTYLDMKK